MFHLLLQHHGFAIRESNSEPCITLLYVRMRTLAGSLLPVFTDGNEEALAQQQTRLHLHLMHPCQLLFLVQEINPTRINQALLGHEMVGLMETGSFQIFTIPS